MTGKPSDPIYDLIIAGAGPVGLFAGLVAQNAGLKTLILEKQSEPGTHSRSIGIHPPSLELFRNAGILEAFLECGEKIHRGLAHGGNGNILGVLDFNTADKPLHYILTIPQWKSEAILEKQLTNRDPGVLKRGCTVTGISGQTPARDTVQVAVTAKNGFNNHFSGRMLLGCDGKNSFVRKSAGIRFQGSPYTGRYAMGDFADNTAYKSDAVIFLLKEGLVECFPLPGNIRRWVVEQDRDHPVAGVPGLIDVIRNRCGIAPDAQSCSMFSEFGVEKYLADAFWNRRMLLAGDAAHVVSPIGGQGMNLGWLNAADAVHYIKLVLEGSISLEDGSRCYSRLARSRAKKVADRAEFNMLLGGSSPFPKVRNSVVRLMLHSPLRHWLRNRFTMQGLQKRHIKKARTSEDGGQLQVVRP